MNLLKVKWTLTWSFGILLLCFLPGKSFPSTDWLTLFQFDKWVHAFLFMMLFLIAFFETRKLSSKSLDKRSFYYWIILAYCVFLAGATELVQHYFTQDRFGDWLDFIANAFGVLIGVLLIEKIKKTTTF